MAMTYSEKLKDPRWQRKRLEVMQRDNFTCCGCGCSDQPLNVHHADYYPGKAPWDYSDDLLTTYCEICHKQAHANRMFLASVFSFLTMELQTAIIGGLAQRLQETSDPQIVFCMLGTILSHEATWKAAATAALPVFRALDESFKKQ